ncbi:unnamed protein product, partial [marine sediment metagenome]
MFEDEKLATDIFTLTEDARIDYLLKQEYAGIKVSYEQIQLDALSERPLFYSLPLREAFLESLIQTSLGGELQRIPFILRGWLNSVLSVLQQVQSRAATVEDSAEATIRLYDIISTIPNVSLSAQKWDLTNSTETGLVADIPPSRDNGDDMATEPGVESPYRNAAGVDFRGSFNPELVQLRLRLKEDPDYAESSSSPLSPEMLKQLAGKEIKLDEVLRGEHPTSGLYTTELPASAKGQAIVPGKQNKNPGKLWTGQLSDETPG